VELCCDSAYIAGNMDISELPFYVVVLLILVAFVAVFVIAKRLSRRWLRWPVRGVASLGMALTVLLLAGFVFGEYSCTARAPRAYSPDGRHVAVLTWGLQGALGADMATVKVRHRYSPLFTRRKQTLKCDGLITSTC
jgi:hypothetical protein